MDPEQLIRNSTWKFVGAEREISAGGKFGFHDFNGVSALLLSELVDHLVLFYYVSPNCARSAIMMQ
jgi:hypothetical protein